MYSHKILMCTDYNRSIRIAFHRSCISSEQSEEFKELSRDIRNTFKTVYFSLHCVPTDQKSFDSVVTYDPFFKDVITFESVKSFKQRVKSAIKVKPRDILNYILLEKPYSNLEIQKLIYFIYEDYFKKSNEPLFDENFFAWRLGPVIPDLYHDLSINGDKKIKIDPSEKTRLHLKLSMVEDKDLIIECVENILSKYDNIKDPFRLVELSHKEGSPWDTTKKNNVISHELVKKYARSTM